MATLKHHTNRFGIRIIPGGKAKAHHPRSGHVVGIVAEIRKVGWAVTVTFDCGFACAPDDVIECAKSARTVTPAAPSSEAQIALLRTTLRGMLEAPRGGTRRAMELQMITRRAAQDAYIQTANDDTKARMLRETIERANAIGVTPPTSFEDAVTQYGMSNLFDIEGV